MPNREAERICVCARRAKTTKKGGGDQLSGQGRASRKKSKSSPIQDYEKSGRGKKGRAQPL